MNPAVGQIVLCQPEVSMKRALLALAVVLVATTACSQAAKVLKAEQIAAKKDCAACEKMCTVAADAEKNPDAVTSCKADCKKSCQP